MAALDDAITYYTNLLISQYRPLPRARQNIAIYVKQALGDLLSQSLATCFDVGLAVGPQLDILGKYVGVSRLINSPISRPYYGFWDTTKTDPSQQNPNGFQDTTNAAVNAQGIWFNTNLNGFQNTALSDEAYAFVIQLKIILNANDGTLASIDSYLQKYLPGLVALVDNENMSLTYTLSQKIPVPPSVLEQFLPKPMGVGINFVTLLASLSADTLSASHFFSGSLPANVSATTAADVATPANGVGPYKYQWNVVSYNRPVGNVSFTIDTPNAASTTFTYTGFIASGTSPNQVCVAVCNCTITDSRGLVATSENVTVTITVGPPP